LATVKKARIHTLNQLLKAYALFEKDIQYVVMDNKVMIVDEQTRHNVLLKFISSK
jgi:preprotein translocase subunit SecA